MSFDPKIKDPTKIVLATEDAERYVGTLGYFADSLDAFSDLGYCKHGMLYAVYADERVFPLNKRRAVGGNLHECFAFFLPAAYVEPDEKKYRPYTCDELMDTFVVGHPIMYRHKVLAAIHRLAFLGYYTYTDGSFVILIGRGIYTAKDLLANYEWRDLDGSWRPFGVKE